MSEINFKMTISVQPSEVSAALYDQLADALWDAEAKDIDLFDSFMGGSLETGELELSICARASDETAARTKAYFALENALKRSGLVEVVSRQEVLELI